MRASAMALVFVAHFAVGFAAGFVGGFVGALAGGVLAQLLFIVALVGAAWLLGRWLSRRDTQPSLGEGAAGAAVAAGASLLAGGTTGVLLSLLNSGVMFAGFRAEAQRRPFSSSAPGGLPPGTTRSLER